MHGLQFSYKLIFILLFDIEKKKSSTKNKLYKMNRKILLFPSSAETVNAEINRNILF